MKYARHAEARGFVAAAPERLFAHLDDARRLGVHMEKPSAMMLGGSMRYAFDAGEGRAVGSVIVVTGDVLGLKLDLEEVVTERTPSRKVWETRGEPHLLVIGPYRMGFEITPSGEGADLCVFVDYDLPQRGLARMMGALFGASYARWCVESMTKDAQRQFGKS